jgi:precorrin-8X/cobalt-precorrin-8 methylmutase
MTTLKKIAPAEIEKLSFAIIEEEFEERTSRDLKDFNFGEFKIIQRVIHATGDFSFASSLVFSAGCIDAGLEAIRSGCDIAMDVTMGASGVSRRLLQSFGGTVRCHINDPGIGERARSLGKTRSETALEKLVSADVGIIAVGNAPTALVAAMEMIEAGLLKPRLVVGVPVGFVNAEESKELLLKKPYPYITNRGRKGGTPVAVAIVNALLRLARTPDTENQ